MTRRAVERLKMLATLLDQSGIRNESLRLVRLLTHQITRDGERLSRSQLHVRHTSRTANLQWLKQELAERPRAVLRPDMPQRNRNRLDRLLRSECRIVVVILLIVALRLLLLVAEHFLRTMTRDATDRMKQSLAELPADRSRCVCLKSTLRLSNQEVSQCFRNVSPLRLSIRSQHIGHRRPRMSH